MATHRYKLTVKDNKGFGFTYGVCSKQSLDKWARCWLSLGYTVECTKLDQPTELVTKFSMLFEYDYNLLNKLDKQ